MPSAIVGHRSDSTFKALKTCDFPPLVAAVTVDARGGGVAQLSRLVWEVCRRRWHRDAALLTLIGTGHSSAILSASHAARFVFGARLASAQLAGRHRSVLFTHLGVARAQAFIPEPLRRPYAVFLNGIEVWKPLTRSQRTVLQKAAIRIANSQYTAERFAQMNPDLGDVAICPLALPPDGVIGRVPELSARGIAQTVLIVGRMDRAERYKGHDQLLEAWPAVLARVPHARLTIVGDGDDAPRLRAKASALALDQHVLFTGFLSDAALHAAYAGASVFAMPSRGEGFGLVYLDAMRHGLPCIGSLHDAAPEVIVDGATGFLVNQGDIAELSSRIVYLLTDTSARHAMGQQALRRVQERFSFEQFACRLESLIDERLNPLRDRFQDFRRPGDIYVRH